MFSSLLLLTQNQHCWPSRTFLYTVYSTIVLIFYLPDSFYHVFSFWCTLAAAYLLFNKKKQKKNICNPQLCPTGAATTPSCCFIKDQVPCSRYGLTLVSNSLFLWDMIRSLYCICRNCTTKLLAPNMQNPLAAVIDGRVFSSPRRAAPVSPSLYSLHLSPACTNKEV